MKSRPSVSFNVTLLFCLFSSSFFAASAEAGPRKRRENRQVQKAKAEKADDKRDVHRFKTFLKNVDSFKAKPLKMSAFDDRVLAAMSAEKAESRQERTTDTREIKGDRARKNRRHRQGKRRAARQEADDRQDRRAENRDLNRIRALKARYKALHGKAGLPAIQKKKAILREVIALNKNEIRKDRQEIKENRRERRRAH